MHHIILRDINTSVKWKNKQNKKVDLNENPDWNWYTDLNVKIGAIAWRSRN